MKYLLHIEIEDEQFGPIEFDQCPVIPQPGDHVTASGTDDAPSGVVEEIEYDYRPAECHIILSCTREEDELRIAR